ncbi:MAG: hypothetical protein AB7O24_19105 [Kofleriaceae bacterium]
MIPLLLCDDIVHELLAHDGESRSPSIGHSPPSCIANAKKLPSNDGHDTSMAEVTGFRKRITTSAKPGALQHGSCDE